MTDSSPRFALPWLQPGQAQKEMFHNEALTLLDAGVQASVVAAGVNVPPATPVPGQCWIVGSAPGGAWAGHAAAMAMWTAGGWRFLFPADGWSVWDAAQRLVLRYDAGAWDTGTVPARRIMVGGKQVLGAQQAAISTPSGGNVIDIEVRQTMGAVLAVLRSHGLVAS